MEAVGLVRGVREEGGLAMLSLEVIQEDRVPASDSSKFCSPTSACLKLWGRRAQWAVRGGVLVGDIVIINGGRYSCYRTYSSDVSIVGSSYVRILYRLKDVSGLNSSSHEWVTGPGMDNKVSRTTVDCANRMIDWVKKRGMSCRSSSRACGKRSSSMNESTLVKYTKYQNLLGIGMQHLVACDDICHGACERILTLLGQTPSRDRKHDLHFTKIEHLSRLLGVQANICGYLLLTKEAARSIMSIRLGKKVLNIAAFVTNAKFDGGYGEELAGNHVKVLIDIVRCKELSLSLCSLTYEEMLQSVFFVQLHGAFVDCDHSGDVVLTMRCNTVCIIVSDQSNSIHHEKTKNIKAIAEPQDANKAFCDLFGSGCKAQLCERIQIQDFRFLLEDGEEMRMNDIKGFHNIKDFLRLSCAKCLRAVFPCPDGSTYCRHCPFPDADTKQKIFTHTWCGALVDFSCGSIKTSAIVQDKAVCQLFGGISAEDVLYEIENVEEAEDRILSLAVLSCCQALTAVTVIEAPTLLVTLDLRESTDANGVLIDSICEIVEINEMLGRRIS